VLNTKDCMRFFCAGKTTNDLPLLWRGHKKGAFEEIQKCDSEVGKKKNSKCLKNDDSCYIKCCDVVSLNFFVRPRKMS
jgi:hypothetical protein